MVLVCNRTTMEKIMFCTKVNAEKERQEIRLAQDLERLKGELSDEKGFQLKVKDLNNEITDLKAQLKIAKADMVRAEVEAKSKYADHAMSINDERIKEMRTVYENYAKNVVEIVKAGTHAAQVIVPTTITAAK